MAAGRSLTSGLIRALLFVHTALEEENQDLSTSRRSHASGMAVALRPDGIYLARAGDALVGSASLGTAWARSWESSDAPQLKESPLGEENPPAITTELLPLEEGDLVLLLPGVTGGEVPEQALAAALDPDPNVTAISRLLQDTPEHTGGITVWWPQPAPDQDLPAPWLRWDAQPAPATVPAAHAARPPSAPWRRPALFGAALAVLLGLALSVGVLGRLGAPDTSAAEAASLIRQAEFTLDRSEAAHLLDSAALLLQPRADRDDQARSLLSQAQATRDRRLDIVRLGNIESFPLPVGTQGRPVSLWNGNDDLFVLDLGAQLLYRLDPAGARVEAWLRPGDIHASQPVGNLITGAWSPPRGANGDGRLLLVDNTRSIVSLSPSGVRRWWPPDGDQWERVGPAAATTEDLFLLDSGRGRIWHYPARVALARSSVAATTQDEPRLSQAIDLATDGDLYLLLPDGPIHKLARGAGPLPFDGTVPSQPLANPVALYAHPDLDRIWALEPSASRVVEFTQQGHYVRQYVFPPNVARGAVGFFVNRGSQSLRLLTPDRVLTAPMDSGG